MPPTSIRLTCREMMYPLDRELAAGGIPVAVTWRVLEIAPEPYCRWLAHPVTDAGLTAAYRANALFDAHYRTTRTSAPGPTSTKRAWPVSRCLSGPPGASAPTSAGGRGSRRSGKKGKTPGPRVHDDLCAVADDKGRVRHEFTATRTERAVAIRHLSTGQAKASSTSV